MGNYVEKILGELKKEMTTPFEKAVAGALHGFVKSGNDLTDLPWFEFTASGKATKPIKKAA